MTAELERRATPQEARERAARIRTNADVVMQWLQDIVDAHTWCDWMALGYGSWDDYLDAEHPGLRAKLPIDVRRQAVTQMHDAGMKLREIGSTLGVSHMTASNDLRAVKNFTEAANQVPAPSPTVDDDVADAEIVWDEPEGDDFVEDDYVPDPRERLDPPPGRRHEAEPDVQRPTPQPAPTPRRPDPIPVPPRQIHYPPAPVTIDLASHDGRTYAYPEPKGRATFNQSNGEGISWAKWSWNPVTGCLHGCDYCYAREIATSDRFRAYYPAGFTPLFHHERLGAPANTSIPTQYRVDAHAWCGRGDCDVCAWRRVFVCSMADLYGRWVPDGRPAPPAVPALGRGLGVDAAFIRRVMADDAALVDLLDRALQNPVGVYKDDLGGFDNVQASKVTAPTGNAESAALRRLRKEAEAGNETAAELRAEVLAPVLAAGSVLAGGARDPHQS